MHTRPARLLLLIAALSLVATLGVGACSPTPTDRPTSTASESASTSPGEPAPSDGPTAAPDTSQTDTSWGRIWDDLPSGFPTPPGATVADDATSEPVSGAFAIADGEPARIASWMQAALETATYSTEALSGPFEDGSVIIDSVGDGDCRIETVIAPMGGLILMTVRYGAACPNR